jgi:DNA repair protein RadC
LSNITRNHELESTLPRERLLRHGAGVLTDSELISLLLRTGTAGCGVLALGDLLLRHFGSLRSLLGATPAQLVAFSGLGNAKACQFVAVLELARRVIREDLSTGSALSRPLEVKQYCLAELGHRKIEHCIALFLDTRLRLIASTELARGTLAQASVYPREVVREALRVHASAMIIAHNHPSGWPEPSDADCLFTRQLQKALSLVDIRLLDHIIVAGGEAVSMVEIGRLVRS